MDPIGWLEDNERYFSREMNGYDRAPVGPYLSTLPLIDRDGKMMDMGSGNGMLLKFLMTFSNHSLVPFGVDINEKAIEQAKKEVLPEFGENFEIGDVVNYHFPEGKYDVILANPFYAKPDMGGFTDRCLDNLNPGGRLLFRIHDDVLRYNEVERLDEMPGFKDKGMSVSEGYGLSFCVFDR